jgi:fatty-acid desaturase
LLERTAEGYDGVPAIAGSMSFQGSVIGWGATHRRQTAA